ncbi:MAG: hypothetical protein HC853_04620 [Anaerolineae bacterium]|nr:hypothetical protein [Anaerolineae bacterium]
MIGVTGSIGKTSTKELISQVLSQRFNVLKSEGNLNNGIGVPLTLLRLTPEHGGSGDRDGHGPAGRNYELLPMGQAAGGRSDECRPGSPRKAGQHRQHCAGEERVD